MNPQLFSVLSEKNRLDIVELLRTGAKPVNEICVRLKLKQPQVSKHLRVLADAGIVEVRPLAQQHYYQLQPKPFKELEIWLERYKTTWHHRLEAVLQKDIRRYGKK